MKRRSMTINQQNLLCVILLNDRENHFIEPEYD